MEGPVYPVERMIYSGYEHGHYFVRLTHDVKLAAIRDVLGSGYRVFGTFMLLVKRR